MATAQEILRDIVNETTSSTAADFMHEVLLTYDRENGKTDFLALINRLLVDKEFCRIVEEVADFD